MSNAKMASTKKTFMIRDRNIPTELKDLDSWLMWRYEENPKPNKKPLKVPYWTNGRKRWGELGGKKDRANLASFEDALEAAKLNEFDGVGLAIMPEHDLTILDIDDCIDTDGVISEFAREVIDSGTYVERSPSGRGLRAVYRGAIVPGEKRNFHIENGERVEVYCGAAYTTFTGNREAGVTSDIIKLPKALKTTLVNGIRNSNQSTDATTGTADDGEGGKLASMNARPIQNMTPAQALRVLQGLPKHWGASGEGTWFQVAAALHMQFDGSEEGYEVLDAWSKDRDGYDEAGNRARWDAGFSHDRGKQNVRSMRNFVFEAKKAGTRFKQSTLESWGLVREAQEKAAETEIELPGEDDETEEKADRAWHPVDISEWGTQERPEGAPPLVKNWIYAGTVVLFSSHGGGGKSYVTLTFGAKAATGGTWFGEEMEQGDVLIVSGEDPVNEIHHRLWGICAAYGIGMADLAGHLDIVDVTGLLHKALYTAGTDYGKTEFTSQFRRMKELIERKAYKYIIIDNLAKFYMANENARPMVDEFVSALAALAAARGIGVVLVGHASKLGSDGYSGSTAWHNSARARWSLNVSEDGNRDLVVEKNNYGATGHGGRFVWDDAKHVIYMQGQIGEGSATNEFGDLGSEEAVLGAVREVFESGGHVPTGDRGRMGPVADHPAVLETIGNDQKLLRKTLKALENRGLLVRGKYAKPNRVEAEEYLPAEYQDPING